MTTYEARHGTVFLTKGEDHQALESPNVIVVLPADTETLTPTDTGEQRILLDTEDLLEFIVRCQRQEAKNRVRRMTHDELLAFTEALLER